MRGIPERVITRMAEIQEEFMPDVCDVFRPTETRTVTGSVEYSFEQVYTNVLCEVTPKILRQIVEHVGGGAIQSALRWNITMPLGTIIELNDRILVHTLDGSDEYEVNGVQSTESWETATVAQCLKVE